MPPTELKLQLQSSFENEDSTPEEQIDDPATPVVLFSDQQGAVADRQESVSVIDVSPVAAAHSPTDLVISVSFPLSEKLRQLRLETRR